MAFHRFIPLRSNFGYEIFTGNNENYDDHPPVWPNNITRAREIFRFFRIGEPAFMQEEMHKALQFITNHPRIELRLTWDRVVSFWMGTPSPLDNFLSADSFFLRSVSVCSFLLRARNDWRNRGAVTYSERLSVPCGVIPARLPAHLLPDPRLAALPSLHRADSGAANRHRRRRTAAQDLRSQTKSSRSDNPSERLIGATRKSSRLIRH